jgi:hypothetical protein
VTQIAHSKPSKRHLDWSLRWVLRRIGTLLPHPLPAKLISRDAHALPSLDDDDRGARLDRDISGQRGGSVYRD